MEDKKWAPSGASSVTMSRSVLGGNSDGPNAPLLDDAYQLVVTAISRVRDVTERVHGFADSVHGSVPEESGGDVNKTLTRSGRGGQLRDALDSLHTSLSTLESEVTRLQSI